MKGGANKKARKSVTTSGPNGTIIQLERVRQTGIFINFSDLKPTMLRSTQYSFQNLYVKFAVCSCFLVYPGLTSQFSSSRSPRIYSSASSHFGFPLLAPIETLAPGTSVPMTSMCAISRAFASIMNTTVVTRVRSQPPE